MFRNEDMLRNCVANRIQQARVFFMKKVVYFYLLQFLHIATQCYHFPNQQMLVRDCTHFLTHQLIRLFFT